MSILYQTRFPEGFAWRIAPNSQLDAVLSTSETDMIGPTIQRASDCGTVRDPFRCVDYEALANEVGLDLFDGIDLEAYRSILSTYVYTPYRTGSDSDLETVLHNAGFTAAVVVKNNNAQDLREVTQYNPIMVCGGENAFCGGENAYAGFGGYEILANGHLTNDVGEAIGYNMDIVPEGENPSDYWGYVDLICGGVTYLPNGDIDSVTELEISEAYEQQFKRLILRTKPLHNWIVMAVSYIPQNLIVQGDSEIPIVSQTGDPIDGTIVQPGV